MAPFSLRRSGGGSDIAAALICGFVCYSVLLAASMCEGTSAALYKHQKISVYVRDILNTTDFLTVPGATDIELTGISAPFGSVFTVSDPVYNELPTVHAGGPLSTENTVGSFRGTATFVSFDGHDMFLQISLSLQSPAYEEGTISLMGVFSYTNRALPIAIVGGTGAFLHASGSATLTHIDLIPGDDQTFRLDLDVYLPSSHHHIQSSTTMCPHVI